MIDFVLVFFILLFANNFLLGNLSKKHLFFDKSLMRKLYWYHLAFFGIYYVYALFNPSDSKLYFKVASESQDLWPLLFVPGTKFISFFAVPFTSLGISYMSVMLICAWMGYVGFVYAYLFFKENITINVKVFKRFDLLTLLLFLPNMHFWTVSLGKGSIIFMGLMVFVYAVRFPQKRIIALLIGSFFVYMVRPHIMFFVLVGVMVGLITGRQKLSAGVKILVIAASIGFLIAASNSILAVADLQNSENIVDDFEQFSVQRAEGLYEKAGSGVDMSNYPLPFKFFTFWFRPLFVDSPSVLGIFSSLENLIYLFLFAKILNRRFLMFIRRAPSMVKMAAITFLTTSFAMTFVMSNLGIIMRQKAMVMYFGFFVIYYFLANEKWLQMQKKNAQTVVS
ncbi:hypothetical protein L1S35_09435 [Flavobacterium sp. AS60]|uniref:hypothetical protein n=1 Tax=Flavobacterium anseongense TaxID=2910677 RepID=UPI001F3DAFE9|nr:hypothetical protein [Flavobacterium sp. AS60]MCF6129897.1 hypothetical protein [Flavobacterium sp. AS60]